MATAAEKVLSRATIAAYLSILAALLLVLLIGLWAAYRDLKLVHQTRLNAEIDKLRAQATRRAGHLEEILENEQGDHQAVDWERLNQSPRLRRYWQSVAVGEGHLYAAVIDPSGLVRLHNDPAIERRQMSRWWYERIVSEAGEGVVQTSGKVLGGEEPAYDVRIPLVVNGREIGNYHEGLSVAAVDVQASASRGQILRRWSIVIGGILFVVLLACGSLYYVLNRKLEFKRAVDAAELRRIEEISQLAAGLAHEIRNPLHAIGLNLHTFRKSRDGQTQLSDHEVSEMIEQSTREIDRLDQLMRQLLGFATPQQARDEEINLNQELQATLDFVEQEMVNNKIEVTTHFPGQPVAARIDPGRLRQILLNLLINAQDAAGEGGRIKVSLTNRKGKAEILIADSGPGVPESERKRIFEPFYSTKEQGTGLGLALVKRFIEEANGNVSCESNGSGGAIFRIVLPSS